MGMDSRHFLIFSIPFLLIILFQLQLYITQTQTSRDEQALSKKTDAVIQRLANEIKELRSSVESSAPKDKYPRQISRVQKYEGSSCITCRVRDCPCLSEIPIIPIGNLYIPGVDTAVLSTTYINLMKATVLNMIYEPDPTKITGEKWPGTNTMTMVGLRRINNVQALMEDIIINNIPGDFIETGAWRGGVCAFAAAIFTAYGQWKTRNVWIADSFKGIPPVNITEYPQDKAHTGSDKWSILTNNPAEKVQDMFKALDLYRPEVKWLIGWFKDTLPRFQKEAKNTKFSIIRLDGDIYESTIQALTFLYPSLSVGGYTIIDDFTDWHGCRTAVLDFRKACGITDEDSPITLAYHKKGEAVRGVWWKKVTPIKPDCWKNFNKGNL